MNVLICIAMVVMMVGCNEMELTRVNIAKLSADARHEFIRSQVTYPTTRELSTTKPLASFEYTTKPLSDNNLIADLPSYEIWKNINLRATRLQEDVATISSLLAYYSGDLLVPFADSILITKGTFLIALFTRKCEENEKTGRSIHVDITKCREALVTIMPADTYWEYILLFLVSGLLITFSFFMRYCKVQD